MTSSSWPVKASTAPVSFEVSVTVSPSGEVYGMVHGIPETEETLDLASAAMTRLAGQLEDKRALMASLSAGAARPVVILSREPDDDDRG